MTVKEMIEFLQTCPEDADVDVYQCYQIWGDIHSVVYCEEENSVQIT